MAASPSHINTFSSGMVGDVDDPLQPAGTYRDARNFRLIYNTAAASDITTAEEQATNGRSLSLELMPGTTEATAIPTGYRSLGSIQSELGLIVFSTNGTNAEIGRITQPWSYETLFNDSRDPNGDTLGLHLGDRLQLRIITENKNVIRIYWVDNYHGLRVFNLYHAFDAPGIPFGQNTSYPKWLSVHHMDAQPRLTIAELLFDQRINGNLLSGAYQLSYRYRLKDGHPSPWSPLTLPIWVMDQALPETETLQNHHRRYFGSSGVATTEGLRFKLTGLDLRWDEVEVALVYHSANVGAERARLVFVKPIMTANLTIDISQFSGTAIPLDDFKVNHQTLTRVGTIAPLFNMLFQVNVDEQKPLTVNAAKFNATFTTFDFVPDTTGEPRFNPMPNPVNASRQDGDKLTNSRRERVTLTRNKYKSLTGFSKTEYVVVNDDFVNFKGQLVQQQFRGYRRGETHGVAAILRDDRGNAFFVQPLGDVTFPELYQSPTSYYDPTVAHFKLRSLGMVLNGIRIPYEVAHYPDGRCRLSSIEIVRTDASGRLGFQGVIWPANVDIAPDDAIDGDRAFKKIEPAYSWNNGYGLPYYTGRGATGHLASFHGKVNNKAGETAAFTINKSYWTTVHAPDVLIDNKLPDRTDAHRLQIVGTAHKSTSANEIPLNLGGSDTLPDSCMQFYTKNYAVNGQSLTNGDSNGRPKMGSLSRIRAMFMHDNADRDHKYEKIDPDNQKATFDPIASLYPFLAPSDIAAGPTSQRSYRSFLGPINANYVSSILQPGSLVVKTQDWEAVDVIESRDSYVSQHIVNYIQPPTLTAPADERVYKPTGYILRIDDYTLSDLPKETDNAGNITYYVLNGLEVFGGDTYINLFDYAKLYPLWDDNCNRRYGYTTDYGVGHIVPIESPWNLAMRGGRSLANNAFFPQAASCDNLVPHATGGIAWTQAEDWNMASVLRPLETLNLYSPQPRGTVLVEERPYSWFYSELKVYGEREDSWRKQLPLNYRDMEGNNGPFTRIEPLLGGIYAWTTRGFGRARILERSLIPTSTGELASGAGKVLDDIDYDNDGLGLQQFSALTVDNSRAYWIDLINRSLCRMSQAGKDDLSEREKAHDLLYVLIDKNVTKLSRLELTINPVDKELWVTMDLLSGNASPLPGYHLHRVSTLIYSEALDVLSGWVDLGGEKYHRYNQTLLATDPLHPNRFHEIGSGEPCQFFNVFYPAWLTWVVNPLPKASKKFDNLVLSVTADGRKALTQLVMKTADDLQTLNLTEFADSSVQYRRGDLLLPLLQPIDDDSEVSRQRLWGKTLRLTLRVEPSLLKKGDRLTVLAAETFYRQIKA